MGGGQAQVWRSKTGCGLFIGIVSGARNDMGKRWKEAVLRQLTGGLQVITQRLSLGEEVNMTTIKSVKKVAVKAPKQLKKAATKVTARNSIKFVHGLDALSLYKPELQVIRLIELLGNNLLADLLSVNRSQPSMWKNGKEKLSVENQRKVSDLDHVMNRLLIELYPDQAVQWMQGSNPHLNFGRPIDALIVNGPSKVLDAIDALASGSYA